jgi:hypothetical protein
MIGWLGGLLPWLVALLLMRFPASISETYYTWEAGAVFMIVLGSASILLMSYKGYDDIDDMLNTIAGIFGITIILFPCESEYELVGTFQIPMKTSAMIHYIAAAMFFALLAYNSLFQFTKSNGMMTKKKKARNVIYRVCGIGMILSFGILLLPEFRIQVWLMEMIALTFFGVSWLTKANRYKWLFAEGKG